MNKIKRISVSALTALSLATCITLPTSNIFNTPSQFSIITSLEANAANGRLYNQNDSYWKNVKFTKYSNSENSMYVSGCGIFSFCNAIYALNGNRADAVEVATWAVNNGSYRPGSGGLYRDAFYNNVQGAFSSKYGFKLNGKYYGGIQDSKLVNHLRNGGVAVVHVKGHFIAVTGYNNGNYHVIESAVWSGRGLSADSWVTASKLSQGNTKVDWFVLISATNPTPDHDYFPKYTGNSSSIVEALKAVGADSSYAYRSKIASANGISNYSGTAAQNTTMLKKLKAGNLIKP